MIRTAAEIRVAVPGDKSITHRALILAALAEGESRIRAPLIAGDTRATASIVRSLGVTLGPLSEEVTLTGLGLSGFQPPERTLDCVNSGTSARLFLGLLAGSPVWAVLTGDASLRSRPMRRVTQPLAQAGGRFHELAEPDRLPIAVEGAALVRIAHESPHASAQIKSALLLAGLTARVPVRVLEPGRSRDHTERLLTAMGAGVTTSSDGLLQRVELEPPDQLEPLDLTVPGDFSSAAYLLAAGLLLSGVSVRIANVGLNPTRIGLLDVLARMGARVRTENVHTSGGEPVGDVVAASASLTATDVDATAVPMMIDEFPVLAVLAARAAGETRVEGAAELRVKESDRIAVLVKNLRAIGVEVEELADGFVVRGTDKALSGRIETHGDHRIAMAFGLLAAQANNRIEIDDPVAASVSFPGFWDVLRGLIETSR